MDKEKFKEIVSISASIAAEKALEIINIERDKARKERRNKRFHNTKRLLRSYRELKVHASESISYLSQISDEDYEFYHNLLEDEKIDVQAIGRTRARSAVMIAHIDAMLNTFEIISMGSSRPEDHRRCRVINALYIDDERMTVKEIAALEAVDERTVYKDIEVACDKLSALLFGIEWIEKE